jgi:hypothetical protein
MEYKLNDLIVRARLEHGEIEITQAHLEDNSQSGVFITPLQITQLHALLESAARELQDAKKEQV